MLLDHHQEDEGHHGDGDGGFMGGFMVELKDYYDRTPLHAAVLGGHVDIMMVGRVGWKGVYVNRGRIRLQK